MSLASRLMRSVTVVVVTFAASIETLFRLTFFHRQGVDFLFRSWGRELLNLARAKLHVEGLENLPEENCLFVFHHSSLLDIPVLYAALPDRQIRFGAKSELFRIPIFGRSIRAVGTLPISREEPKEVRRLYEETAKNRPSGIDYALAAEGTRQDTNQIGNFKTGPFIFAITAQVPIVPVVIAHADQVLSKADWIFQKDRVTIRVRVLPAVATSGMGLDQRMNLKFQVREMMQEGLSDLISSSAQDRMKLNEPKRRGRFRRQP